MDYSLPPDIYNQLVSPSAYEAKAPDELSSLYQMRAARTDSERADAESGRLSGLRLNAVRQEALRQGATSGLSWRYTMILDQLEQNEGTLERVFNFAPFLEDGRVLVPAVARTEAIQSFDDDGYTEVLASFTIREEARIVSVAPTFRDYLYREYQPPSPPHPMLLPKNSEEQAAWKAAIMEGWELGVEQADQVFSDNLYQLQRAVEGRINYRAMLAMGYIEPASVQVTDVGVTFNGRTLNVGESFVQIKTEARYRPVGDWRAVWGSSDDR